MIRSRLGFIVAAVAGAVAASFFGYKYWVAKKTYDLACASLTDTFQNLKRDYQFEEPAHFRLPGKKIDVDHFEVRGVRLPLIRNAILAEVPPKTFCQIKESKIVDPDIMTYSLAPNGVAKDPRFLSLNLSDEIDLIAATKKGLKEKEKMNCSYWHRDEQYASAVAGGMLEAFRSVPAMRTLVASPQNDQELLLIWESALGPQGRKYYLIESQHVLAGGKWLGQWTYATTELKKRDEILQWFFDKENNSGFQVRDSFFQQCIDDLLVLRE